MKDYCIKTSDSVVVVHCEKKRIKNFHIRLRAGEFFASLPQRATEEQISSFFTSITPWVQKNRLTSPLKRFDGQEFWYNGVRHTVVYHLFPAFSYSFDEEYLHIFSPFTEEKAFNATYKALHKDFLAKLNVWLEEFCAKYPHNKPALALNHTTATWGKYYKTDNRIRINFFLVGKSERAQKMVLFHEFCHLDEFNHSKAFYSLLSREFPDYKTLLKE